MDAIYGSLMATCYRAHPAPCAIPQDDFPGLGPNPTLTLTPFVSPQPLPDSASRFRSLTRVLYRVTTVRASHCSDALFRYFSKNVYWLWLDVREPRKVPRTVPGGCPGGAVGGTVSMVCRCARSPIPHAIVTLKMTVADFLKTVRLRTPPHRDGPQRRG